MIAVGAVVTSITLENTGAAQVSVPITFGQVFKQGDLPAGSAVELRAPDGAIVPCQFDVKATHGDGSIRHGALSAIIPALANASSVAYSIVRAASAPAGAAAVPSDFPGLNAVVTISDNGTDVTGPTAGTVYTADASARLAAGTYQTWLSGPIVSEWIVRVPFVTAGGAEHPDLHARFSIRAYKGQAKAKIDYIVENTWAKEKAVPSGTTPWETVSVAPAVYSFSLKAGIDVVHTRAKNGYLQTKLTFNANGVYDNNATGLPNDATVFTATVTADGVAKPISIVGSQAQTFSQLRALINTQLGGAATCTNAPNWLGLLFVSATTGVGSTVTIDYGTLFPALAHTPPYRPIRGDEYIHYAGTRWKKTHWWGAAPSIHIRHDKQYLIATKAVPNYEPGLVGSPSVIAANLATMQTQDIGGNGISKAYMGDVGYAPGIGVLPEWTALYVVNQGVDAKAVMLKQADLQGSWPVHTRDFGTDHPINFADWPYATYSPNVGDSRNAATGLNEKLPSYVLPASLPDTMNKPDVAHHPDFCFVPYLVTADHYYMEGLVFYNRFVALDTNSHDTFRGGRKCLWQNHQVRGQAWAMRTAVHALYITPDAHPLRGDIQYCVDQNVLWYDSKYVDPAGPLRNIFGHFGALIYSQNGAANTGNAPWQEDFVTSACGRAIELGFSSFTPLLTYKARQITGRLTSGPDFCWQVGSAYSLRYRESSASPLYTSWNEVYLNTFSSAITSSTCGSVEMAAAISTAFNRTVAQNAMVGYTELISGFPANMQPAVAYCATFDIAGCDDAWTVFDARTSKPDYNAGPQFAIVPRTLTATTPDPDPAPEEPPTTTQEAKMSYPDRVQETTNTAGTGPFTLSGVAEAGFRTFGAAVAIGVPVPYCAVLGAQWEVGTGVLTDALTMARTPTASSNGGALVDFAAGAKEIFATVPGAKLMKFASADDAATAAVVDAATSTILIEEAGVTKRITMANFMAALGVGVGSLPAAAALADADKLPVVQGVTESLVTVGDLKTYLGAVGGTPADTTGPTMGGTLTSSSVTASGFTLGGYSATDNVGVTGYEYSLDSGSTWTNAGNTTSIVVTGRTASTTYQTRVRAYDAAGNRAATPLSLAVTTSAASGDATAPTMSGSLTASNITSSGYDLSWTAGSDNVGVTGYEYSTDAGVSWVAAGTSLTVNVTGKAASTTYDNRIRCFDAVGLRSNVLTASVTTAAAAATQASLYTLTDGTTALAATAAFAGGTEPNRYWAPNNFNVYVKAADNTYPATGTVRGCFGKDPLNPPVAYTGSAWPTSIPYASNGGTTGNVPNSTQLMNFVNQASFPGLFSPATTCYGGGTAGDYYFFLLFPDGSWKCYTTRKVTVS